MQREKIHHWFCQICQWKPFIIEFASLWIDYGRILSNVRDCLPLAAVSYNWVILSSVCLLVLPALSLLTLSCSAGLSHTGTGQSVQFGRLVARLGEAGAEFLKVTVSRLCDRAHIFWLCAKSWDLYAQTTKLCILNSFTVFFFLFHAYELILSDIFAIFLAQNFKTKVLTAQKNLLLECLGLA